MPRLRTLSLGLVIAVSFCIPASADPIRIATYTDSLGLTTAAPVTLPDLSTGGSVVLGTLPVFVIVAALQRFLVRGISMGAVKG